MRRQRPARRARGSSPIRTVPSALDSHQCLPCGSRRSSELPQHHRRSGIAPCPEDPLAGASITRSRALVKPAWAPGCAACWYGAGVCPRRWAEARSPVAEAEEAPHPGARLRGLERAIPRLQPPGGRGGTAGAHAARGRCRAHYRGFRHHDRLPSPPPPLPCAGEGTKGHPRPPYAWGRGRGWG